MFVDLTNTLNAFWKVPLFNIYASLTVDDLHQLGGVYKHLLQCLESSFSGTKSGETNKQLINARYFNLVIVNKYWLLIIISEEQS